jgi:predicted SAM-dependent methyltransferase
MNDDIARNVTNPVRLHIGGVDPKPGWKILNVQPGPTVDVVGDCTNLGQFSDESVAEIYGSHVLEHLSYIGELETTLREFHRVLVPGGKVRISVPDFELLCRMFLHPSLATEQRFYIMRMVFGGQTDPTDFHKVGLTWEFLATYLNAAGFSGIKRVSEFNIFENDCSSIRYMGQLISLNVEAQK